jgi:hypothetical protein
MQRNHRSAWSLPGLKERLIDHGAPDRVETILRLDGG